MHEQYNEISIMKKLIFMKFQVHIWDMVHFNRLTWVIGKICSNTLFSSFFINKYIFVQLII